MNTRRTLLLAFGFAVGLSPALHAEDKPDAVFQAAKDLMAAPTPAPSAPESPDAVFQAAQGLMKGETVTTAPAAPVATPTDDKAADSKPAEEQGKPAEKPAADTPTTAVKSYGEVSTEKTPDGQTLTYFTVNEGASLSMVATQLYGSTEMYHQIYEANRDKLASPDVIPTGFKLLLPTPPSKP
jgi:nucleoid-associated protein YgaU